MEFNTSSSSGYQVKKSELSLLTGQKVGKVFPNFILEASSLQITLKDRDLIQYLHLNGLELTQKCYNLQIKPIIHQNAKYLASGTFASPNAKDSTSASPNARIPTCWYILR